MNQATNVNIVPSYGQRGDLHFSQYDVGRTATINLYAVNEAYTIPVGATVKIQATKPSGLGFDVACTFSGSVVTVVSTETMTAEAGRFPAELHIIDNSDVIGTANFMFVVEASPHPDGTIDGDQEYIVNEIEALVLEAEGWAKGTQNGTDVSSGSPYYHNNAKWFATHPQFSDEFKQALLDCFENVAWIGNDGQDYYDALVSAMSPQAELLSISAVYTQSGNVYTNSSLDDLKADLVVTGTYDDTSTATVPSSSYTLSGSLTVGTSTITVTYDGKTTTFNVTVSTGWKYVPSMGLLRNQSFINNFTQGSLNYTETVVGDHLHIEVPANSGTSNNQTYGFIPSSGSKATLKVEIKINSIAGYATNNTSAAGYITFRLSNGTGGANFGFGRYGTDTATIYLRAMVGTTVQKQVASVTAETYHTVEASIENSTQTIKLDGNTVLTDNLATQYTTSSRIYLFGLLSTNVKTDLDIKSMEYYES